MKEPNTYNTPKDFFIYLLSVITLYIFFSSLIFLLFSYVNIIYPEYLSSKANLASIRWFLAMLIISLPVLLYTLIMMRIDYLHYPEKRNLKVRKWLLYFTLFLAALIIMGDLGTLLYHFLGGDITQRFLLKSLIMLISTAGLFYFYLRELHQGWNSTQINVWLGLILTISLLTMAYGFYWVGTPLTARKLLFDEKRVEQLNQIQFHILEHWKQTKQLPPSLAALSNNPFTGFNVPKDPKTNAAYGYAISAKNHFKLCAQFEKSSAANKLSETAADNSNWNWIHPAGYFCFERTIDPQLYSRN